jgi:pyrimidine-specific ribonucleoside hydrolase
MFRFKTRNTVAVKYLNFTTLELKNNSMRILFLWVFLMAIWQISAHPWKPKSYVVVDTDGGIDDFRTLILLLNSKDVSVLAITVSNGATPAKVSYQKVKNLLRVFHQEGILVGINTTEVTEKPFAHAIEFPWTDSAFPGSPEVSYIEVLERIQTFSSEKITFIQLASPLTLSSYLTLHPDFTQRIQKVLWTVDNQLEESWNYLLSPISYKNLVGKKIPVLKIESNEGVLTYHLPIKNNAQVTFNSKEKAFLKSIENATSEYGTMLFDELSWLYLTDSSVFQKTNDGVKLKKGMGINEIGPKIFNAFNENAQNNYQVLNYFPLDSALYLVDVSSPMKETILKFGMEEWAVCVITNELHRHVGIYAIVGAKMGVRVREYFGTGPDELKVLSLAGSIPPLSCMNDGIQVSTGATAGHGLLQISSNQLFEPTMVFEYLGQKVKVTLKETYHKEIAKEVEQLVVIYGINSNVYWDLVRQIALNIWFRWDRNQMFEISPVE